MGYPQTIKSAPLAPFDFKGVTYFKRIGSFSIVSLCGRVSFHLCFSCYAKFAHGRTPLCDLEPQVKDLVFLQICAQNPVYFKVKFQLKKSTVSKNRIFERNKIA